MAGGEDGMAAKRVKVGMTGAAGVAGVADAAGVMRGSFRGESPAAGQGSRAVVRAAEVAARATRFAAWLEACPPEWRELFDAP